MEEIEKIRDKYIKQVTPDKAKKQPLGQNLQPDIVKIEGIIRKISDKQATQSELYRLRTTVIRLLATIDNNGQYHI